MKNYWNLLMKRLFRLLSGALLAAAVLFAAIAALLGGAQQAARQETVKFPLALCGSTDDPMVQLGITALKQLDATRFSVDLYTMTEAEAQRALTEGDISAYVVLPERFMESAMNGDIPTVRYVTLPGSTGPAAIFQRDVTQVISHILLSAQKGVYGISRALRDNGLGSSAHRLMNDLAIKYAELALIRENICRLRILGMDRGLELRDYLCCGLGVLLTFLLCLSFAPIAVQRDVSLNRMLAVKGHRAACQALADFSALLLGMGVLAAALLAVSGAFLPFPIWSLLPVTAMAAAFSFFVFSLTSSLMSSVVLHFLLSIGMCFCAGCMYPVSFFPDGIQRLAPWLPAGACREILADCAIGGSPLRPLAAIAGWAAVFLTAAVFLRCRRVRRIGA